MSLIIEIFIPNLVCNIYNLNLTLIKMEGFEQNAGLRSMEREEIFSKPVRAGKRTYFFDVKATRQGDYYLTVTESKKRLDHDGSFFFEKHKIFLYKEDFDKFSDGLQEVVDYIKNLQSTMPQEDGILEEVIARDEYVNVSFEDLNR
jgi:hypothetical protein